MEEDFLKTDIPDATESFVSRKTWLFSSHLVPSSPNHAPFFPSFPEPARQFPLAFRAMRSLWGWGRERLLPLWLGFSSRGKMDSDRIPFDPYRSSHVRLFGSGGEVIPVSHYIYLLTIHWCPSVMEKGGACGKPISRVTCTPSSNPLQKPRKPSKPYITFTLGES